MHPEKNWLRKSESLVQRARKGGKDQKGVALVMTMLLLLLLTGLSVVMVVSSNSDLLTNGYYRGFRGAFYASDSGLNIARQAAVNQILASATANWGVTTQPFAASVPNTVQTYITNTYGTAFTAVTGAGQSAGSWPGSFEVTSFTLAAPTCQVVGGGGTCAAPTGAVTGYSYIFPYTMVTQGRAQGTEKSTLSDRGAIIMNASLVANSTTQSFAAWGMFIDQYPICSGGTLVPGTISGPVFTNGAWTFGTSGSYIFTDTVGSASSKAGYQFSGSCSQVAGNSATSGGTTIAPTFQNGFNLGQPSVPLPPNDFNQEQAVLDGKGVASGAITNAQLNATLKNISQTAYPVGGTASGVYLPYSVVGGVKTFTGGGIYIQGNSTVKLSTSGASAQVYTIVQGGTTTTVTVNPATNTTTMVSGGTTLTVNGVPDQYDPATGALDGPATMLYDNGAITNLTGPGQGVPAIQNGSAVTITANGDVTITGDILYATEPVTLAANQIPGTPADTLIPGNNNGQTLGIFTANGNIDLANSQSNGNLEIDGSIATVCASGGSCTGNGGLQNTGNAINTLNIVGGRIQNQIMNINTTTRNVFFDRRYAQNGFAPPWFPSTTVAVGNVNAGTITPSVSRVQWMNETAYF